jgi:hypothetical protein
MEQLDRHDSDSLITIRTPTEGRKWCSEGSHAIMWSHKGIRYTRTALTFIHSVWVVKCFQLHKMPANVMVFVLFNLKCRTIKNKFSRQLKLNILSFINVTEVSEYVVRLFRILDTWFLKIFQCEVKVGWNTSFSYKGGSVCTTEITNNFCIPENRRILT